MMKSRKMRILFRTYGGKIKNKQTDPNLELIRNIPSTEPVLKGEWLSPGTHINAIGANYEYRRELDSAAVSRASVIASDDLEQVKYEATDLAAPVSEGVMGWDKLTGLGEIVAGKRPGRTDPSDITIFKSLGVALEDVALAAAAYEKALALGIGQQLPDLAG